VRERATGERRDVPLSALAQTVAEQLGDEGGTPTSPT